MNVKYSHASTAFSHDPTCYETTHRTEVRDKHGHTPSYYRLRDAAKRKKKGIPERVLKFDKAVPSCDCKGRVFKVVPLKANTKDECGHCGYYVKWTFEIFTY